MLYQISILEHFHIINFDIRVNTFILKKNNSEKLKKIMNEFMMYPSLKQTVKIEELQIKSASLI